LLVRGKFVVVDQFLFHYTIRFLVTRTAEPLPGYLLNRLFAQKAGHRGNLALLFRRNHTYHASMRRVIMTEAPLPLWSKLILSAAVLLKELWMPLRAVPVGVLKELGLWKAHTDPRATG